MHRPTQFRRLVMSLLACALALSASCIFGTEFDTASSPESDTTTAGDVIDSSADTTTGDSTTSDTTSDAADSDVSDTAPRCDVDQQRCGDQCVNTSSNLQHCGDCNTPCPDPDAVHYEEASCQDGTCVYTCTSGWVDQTSEPGCESDCSETGTSDEEEACDGVDNDCDGQVDEGLTEEYVADIDEDGYYGEDTRDLCGPEGEFQQKLSELDIEDVQFDCYDYNEDANPGIDDDVYFAEPRGDSSFDYDCSDGEERELDETATCTTQSCGAAQFTCTVEGDPDTWYQNVPDCGEEGAKLQSCNSACRPLDFLSCRRSTAVVTTATQRCR